MVLSNTALSHWLMETSSIVEEGIGEGACGYLKNPTNTSNKKTDGCKRRIWEVMAGTGSVLFYQSASAKDQ